MGRFSDRVALVTGAAGDGIGHATAQRLADEGARVVITDIHEGRLHKVTDQMAAKYGADRIVGLPLDASNREMIDSVLKEAADRMGTIEILINNAGVVGDVREVHASDFHEFGDVLETTTESWDYVLALDLSGPWYLTRGVLPGMRKLGRGSIVNVSTITAYMPTPGESAYSSAKAGLQALTRSVAHDMGRQGIRCNAVAPAHVMGNFIRRNRERFQPDMDRMPLKRFAEPEEVASVIAFLASDDAIWVNGETIVLGGGFYMFP